MLTAPVIRIVLDQATWIGFHLIALHDPFDSGFTVHDVLIRLIGRSEERRVGKECRL